MKRSPNKLNFHNPIFSLFNAQCLLSNFDDLDEYLKFKVPDVVAITETWFSPNTSIPLFPGYQAYKADRLNVPHGGVLLLISNTHSVIMSKSFCFGRIEMIYCDVVFESVKLRLILVYRSGLSAENSNVVFFEKLKKVCDIDFEILLMGDFNFLPIGVLSSFRITKK